MTVLMVTYAVDRRHVDEVKDGIGRIVAALHERRPEGVRYAMGTLPDGVTFAGLLDLDDGVDNPIPGLPEGRAFQQRLGDWVVGARPAPQPLEIVGAYRLFAPSRRA